MNKITHDNIEVDDDGIWVFPTDGNAHVELMSWKLIGEIWRENKSMPNKPINTNGTVEVPSIDA